MSNTDTNKYHLTAFEKRIYEHTSLYNKTLTIFDQPSASLGVVLWMQWFIIAFKFKIITQYWVAWGCVNQDEWPSVLYNVCIYVSNYLYNIYCLSFNENTLLRHCSWIHTHLHKKALWNVKGSKHKNTKYFSLSKIEIFE